MFRKFTKSGSSGFTLIELMVVIAIISLLSSIIFFSLTAARAKASDAQKITEAGQVQTALALYYDKHGTMPTDYAGTGVPAQEGTPSYTQSLQPLVNDGDIASIPQSSNQPSYFYDNYGPGSTHGAVFGATLQITDPATVAQPTCQTKTDPASLYPGLVLSFKGRSLYDYTTQNNSGTGRCARTILIVMGVYLGTSQWTCSINYPSKGTCTWSTDQNFTTVTNTPTGTYCQPVIDAEQCSGSNYCVCNPY